MLYLKHRMCPNFLSAGGQRGDTHRIKKNSFLDDAAAAAELQPAWCVCVILSDCNKTWVVVGATQFTVDRQELDHTLSFPYTHTVMDIVSKKSSKKFSKKYSKKYSTFWVLFWVLKKVLKKVLLLNIAQKSAQKSAQKRDKLLKCDKFAQKSAQKSQIYSFLSRILKKVL